MTTLHPDQAAVQEFLLWETASRDSIDFKKIYVDITADLIAGLMLSQIVYWHLPDRDGRTRLRVERDGHLWLVKARREWWQECRVTDQQARRAITVLKGKDLIVTEVYKFGGVPMTHIRLNWSAFLTAWREALYQQPMDLVESTKSKWVNPPNPSGGNTQNHPGESTKSLTETTAEKTTKNITENSTTTTGDAPVGQSPNQSEDNVGVVEDDLQKTKTQRLFDFLTETCGVWEGTARPLSTKPGVDLKTALQWWAILVRNDNIRNPAAVLIHHLSESTPPPPLNNEQRYRYDNLYYEYYPYEMEEEEEDDAYEEDED